MTATKASMNFLSALKGARAAAPVKKAAAPKAAVQAMQGMPPMGMKKGGKVKGMKKGGKC